MNTSTCIDTDILIHFYNANLQHILYDVFDKIYYHSYLFDNELFHKAPDDTWDKIEADVDNGKIIIVSEVSLNNDGLLHLFKNELDRIDSLFDLGEAYSIATARILGISLLTTDDTKDDGPHYYCNNDIIEDVRALAYYEVAYIYSIKHWNSKIDMINIIRDIISYFSIRPNIRSKVNLIKKRFIQSITTEDSNILLSLTQKSQKDITTWNSRM